MPFEDHFSRLSATYARYRPSAPAALFDYLAAQAPGRALAWDCGTGNGQAARALGERFDCVVATDASAQQIAQAEPHERVEYRVEPAEAVTLPDASTDLVAASVAAHWFDFDPFHREVWRVLKPRGVLAAWVYHLPVITPDVDRVVSTYERDVVGPYWPERFHYVREHYRTLPFPQPELETPPFVIRTRWTLDQLAGFLASWSGSQRYLERVGRHPLSEVWDDLHAAWGDAREQRDIEWPLYLRVARKP
ncbi:MAG TPA: class I SAM-dependent methyltransferase [Gemmatimonadaceae bacterium]|nr:class I SAM-dependent methyltransferase [Gemmatimonadaceae bacterium]